MKDPAAQRGGLVGHDLGSARETAEGAAPQCPSRAPRQMESSGGRAPGRAWLAMAGLTTAGWVLWRRLDCPNGRNRTIIIGDVHGCEPELVEMLRRVSPSRRCGDQLIFLGDVIGKGPQPLRSLRLAREQVESLGRGEVLMGNHEAAVVRWFDQRDAGVPARKRAKLLSRASIALAQSLTATRWRGCAGDRTTSS